MVKPITPKEVKTVQHSIPDFIIEAVNKLIQQNWDGEKAVIEQKEIFKLVANKQTHYTKKQICDKQWLDFEDIYRQAGWNVMYDQPAYCEEYFEPYFKFTKRYEL